MAESVVDHVEVVDVQTDHGETLPVPPRTVDRPLQITLEERTVAETCHTVVERLMEEQLDRLLALGDVAQHPNEERRVVGITVEGPANRNGAESALGIGQRQLAGLLLAGLEQQLVAASVQVQLRRQIEIRPADQRTLLDAQQ